jgi:hypothetical protein
MIMLGWRRLCGIGDWKVRWGRERGMEVRFRSLREAECSYFAFAFVATGGGLRHY